MQQTNKKAFSLIELIFAIVVIGIISTVAIPKLMNINSKATVSTIKQDTNSIISSSLNYYTINNKLDKITDAINLNSTRWDITDKKVIYKENGKDCITFVLSNDKLSLNVDKSAGKICEELYNEGIVTKDYDFN